MAEFKYQEPFPVQKDSTEYRLLTRDHVKTITVDGREILKVEKEGLELLAREAYADVSFYLRASHLEKLANILADPEASDNDKFVAHTMLMNQVVAAEGQLPTCQDTGTAICIGKKGENVWTGCNDAEAISRGVFETYRDRNLRYSQVVPFTMTEEKNSGCNLPAQIDIYATQGNKYEVLFITKGGGSANKTFLYQQTKALLNEETLTKFLQEKVGTCVQVLCDGVDEETGGRFVGRAYWSAPEIDGKVYFRAPFAEQGKTYAVHITAADSYDLYGQTPDFEG